MRDELPLKPKKKGNWVLKKFTVTPPDAELFNLKEEIQGTHRYIRPDEYRGLYDNGQMVMSNSPAEKADHKAFLGKVKGSVLIAGLGMGYVIHELLKMPQITDITVIEKSVDVIDMISEFYQNEKVRIVHDDIFEWTPDKNFDHGWFDIRFAMVIFARFRVVTFVRFKGSI